MYIRKCNTFGLLTINRDETTDGERRGVDPLMGNGAIVSLENGTIASGVEEMARGSELRGNGIEETEDETGRGGGIESLARVREA